jgi:hypothetical protein
LLVDEQAHRRAAVVVENTVPNNPRDRIAPLPVVAGQSNHLGRDSVVVAVSIVARDIVEQRSLLLAGSARCSVTEIHKISDTHATTHVEIDLVVS